jgi:glutathione synthase/RimK-type ligase-like ATP-grasp enzyme
MSPTILILSSPQDRHLAGVRSRLVQRGARVILLNPAEFPGRAQLVSEVGGGRGQRGVVRLGSEEVRLEQVRSIWNRRPDPAAAGQTGPLAEFVRRETTAALSGALGAAGVFWLPARPYVISRAELKVEQLHAAAAVGFEVPPTLITNDPRELVAFYNANQGRIISKVIDGAAMMKCVAGFSRYTELVSSGDLGFVDRIRNCPTLFQAYVPKRSELRVTVVGDRVFAAEIDSQRSRHTQIDWRRYDLSHTPHRPHHLPPELEQRCLAMLEHLGLAYGAFDFVLTPDGRYVFLEVNPNGQYGWIQDLVGLPIDEAVADVLMCGGARTAQVPRSAAVVRFASER